MKITWKLLIFFTLILLLYIQECDAKRGDKKKPKPAKDDEADTEERTDKRAKDDEANTEERTDKRAKDDEADTVEITEETKGGDRISVANRENVCEGTETSGSCTMVKNLGDRVDMRIDIRGRFSPEEITWYRRVKVYEEPNLQTIPLLKNGRPPDNMYMSNNRSQVVILHLRDYDVSSNSFKVVLNVADTLSEQIFIIDLEPIDIGIQHIGDSLEINIDKYITLPTYAAYLFWFMESKSELPSNVEATQNGHLLQISNLMEENYGVVTCVVYSTDKYFVAKRRFRVSREIEIYPLSPVYPREIFRPVGSSASFAVRIIGEYKPENLIWYKGLTKVDVDTRADVLLSDEGRNLTVLHLKKSDYGSYICTIKDEVTQKTLAKTDFQLSQPVFDHYGDIAHYWDFGMMQQPDAKSVAFLDTISHRKSIGTCADTGDGIVGKSVYLNMERRKCDGYFTLFEDKYAEECLIEPDNCIDGLSMSMWVNLQSATGDDWLYLLCGEPRGLCMKGKLLQGKVLNFNINIQMTTTERRWRVDGMRLSVEEWHNIVVSWDPIGEMRVYLNAELIGSVFGEDKQQLRVDGEVHFAYLARGSAAENDISYPKGQFDELVIWYQRVISAKETATMFLQVRGMGPYEEDASIYEFEVNEGDSVTFHCPYQIPLLFRSHLNWVRDDKILAELRGRSDVRVIADTMLDMTCQYFSGSRLVLSEPFKIKFQGVPEEQKNIHELRTDAEEEVTEQEDKHNEMILQFQKTEQPAGVEQKEVLHVLPCASYPCLNDGTCENQEVKYELGGNTVTDYLYKCICTEGYVGENCQKEKSVCHSNPCVHGRCLENADNTNWQCLCLPGFQGTTCGEDVNECDDATLNDCSPFAVCENSEGSYQCECQAGYHGDGKQCTAQKVKISIANPSICDHYMEKVHKCIIITHQLHQCGIDIDMDITGKYRTDQIVWLKHIAKLNRTSAKATQFKDEEVEFMVSEDGKKKQFSCEESDFAENYFTVEVQNGQIPTPKFTIKILHKSIELGPQLPNKPFGVNVYNFDLFPHNDWIGKWVMEKTHEFTVLDPPDVTYQYHITNLDSNTIGYLTYYAYDGDEKQVASRRFHDELDINECELGTHDCDEFAECENTPSSFICHCHTGYEGSGRKCEDLDECNVFNMNNCDRNADCVNAPGSYECHCKDGYKGDGHHCTEIDCPELPEFANGRMSGGSHSYFDNAIFSCYNGYRLSGSKALTCLQTGQWSADPPVCEDVNECEVSNYCDSRAICSNLPGTFECQCQTGYLGDGTHCTDIDECQSSNPCHHHARCTNVDGGFTCTCYHSAAMAEDSTCGEYGGYRNKSMMIKYKEAALIKAGVEVIPVKELETPVNLNISKMEYNKTRIMEIQTKRTVLYALKDTNYKLSCFPGAPELILEEDPDYMYPDFLWVMDNKEHLSRDRFKSVEDQLYVRNIQAEDSGGYTCHVKYYHRDSLQTREVMYQYLIEVFTLPKLNYHLALTYATEGCYDSHNYQHREDFVQHLDDSVCNNNTCRIRNFEMKCGALEEGGEERQRREFPGPDQPEHVLHHLTFQFWLLVEPSMIEIENCNRSCILDHMNVRMEKAYNKLEKFVATEENYAANKTVVKGKFYIMKHSLKHSLYLSCRAGYGLVLDKCVACPPGSYSSQDNSRCLECWKGSYQSEYCSETCELCPDERSTDKTGATSLSKCKSVSTSSSVAGSVAGGLIVAFLVLAFVVYKVIRKCFRGSAQDRALKGMKETVTETLDSAKDTIKGTADEMKFKADMATSDVKHMVKKKRFNPFKRRRRKQKDKGQTENPQAQEPEFSYWYSNDPNDLNTYYTEGFYDANMEWHYYEDAPDVYRNIFQIPGLFDETKEDVPEETKEEVPGGSQTEVPGGSQTHVDRTKSSSANKLPSGKASKLSTGSVRRSRTGSEGVLPPVDDLAPQRSLSHPRPRSSPTMTSLRTPRTSSRALSLTAASPRHAPSPTGVLSPPMAAPPPPPLGTPPALMSRPSSPLAPSSPPSAPAALALSPPPGLPPPPPLIPPPD